MQPFSFVERWPILHSALSHSTPSTVLGVTCTPSKTPSSRAAADVGEVSDPKLADSARESSERDLAAENGSPPFGEIELATGSAASAAATAASAEDAKLTRLLLSLLSEAISRPGGGRIAPGDDVGELAGDAALPFLVAFGADSAESTCSASNSGRDFAFTGKATSSLWSSGISLRRSNLCSDLSLDMSSKVFFFQSSSSMILFWSDAIWVQRYCTHCAKEAACFAATSAWNAAQVAFAAWMLLRSCDMSPSPAAAAADHQLASLGEPSPASACGFSIASSISADGSMLTQAGAAQSARRLQISNLQVFRVVKV
mmetsp:Transcript_106305/g.282856  ORF Transcript_106305/g.282856 Transcript_106305/m.282856 type:complete len:314 (+) Transcript_106305:540-1481(+)